MTEFRVMNSFRLATPRPIARASSKAHTDDKGTQLDFATEWARGRDIIEKCNERIHDIRKVGLAFLTGLLTVQGILGLKEADKPIYEEKIANVALVVLAFSLTVILATRFLEKQAQLLQASVAARCLVLESYLPTELTDTIHDRWTRQRWPLLTFLLYGALGGLGLSLYRLMYRDTPADRAMWLFEIFAVFLAVFSWMDLRPTSVPGLDWSVSTTRAKIGDVVQVRVMNLSHFAIRLPSVPRLDQVPCHLPNANEQRTGEAQASVPCKGLSTCARKLWSVAKSRWWSLMDRIHGHLEILIIVGSVVTLGWMKYPYTMWCLLAWSVGAALIACIGIVDDVELLPISAAGWPLAASILAYSCGPALDSWLPVPYPYLDWLVAGTVICVVAIIGGSIFLCCRAYHATRGEPSPDWPESWKRGDNVFLLPPLQSFVWIWEVPNDVTAKCLRIKFEEGPVYLRKKILIVP